jgi:hypothetical protein
MSCVSGRRQHPELTESAFRRRAVLADFGIVVTGGELMEEAGRPLPHPADTSCCESARGMMRIISTFHAGEDERFFIARLQDVDAAIGGRMDSLAAALTPDEIPQPSELLQARRNAVMRRKMLSEFGYYTAEELADMHGSTARNRYALATRWTRSGRMFSVPLGTRSVFPAFQFDEHGEPYPVVAEALSVLPRDDMSQWGVALWFYANNAWLPGEARPADLVGGPEQSLIVDAARKLSEPEPL